jgi:hypothetical protein
MKLARILSDLGAVAGAAGRAVATRWTPFFQAELVRERLKAAGAFASIALFAAASFDYLLTGGPDWGLGAQASPIGGANIVELTPLPEVAYARPADRQPVDPPRQTPAPDLGPFVELLGAPIVETAAPVKPVATRKLNAA